MTHLANKLNLEKGMGVRFGISLVIPVFNERETIVATLSSIDMILEPLCEAYDFEVVIIDDGSHDGTSHSVHSYHPLNCTVRLVELSRNFGKEAAISAGLEYATGDAVIPLDADLQDPPELIPAMIEKWRQGFEVVLARRSNRDSDSWLKRRTAQWFYQLMGRVAEISLPADVGDFRLMDRSVVNVINNLPENRRFMKGLFAWAGFHSCVVEYTRPVRAAGTTKFNTMRLMNLAIEGITSFSTAPLRLLTYLGLIVAFLAMTYASWIIVRTMLYGIDVPGYASLLTIVLILSSIQLIGLGIIGEYVGRTYIESKRRPAYVVRGEWSRKQRVVSDKNNPSLARN